jgi:hypothetical protein
VISIQCSSLQLVDFLVDGTRLDEFRQHIVLFFVEADTLLSRQHLVIFFVELGRVYSNEKSERKRFCEHLVSPFVCESFARRACTGADIEGRHGSIPPKKKEATVITSVRLSKEDDALFSFLTPPSRN